MSKRRIIFTIIVIIIFILAILASIFYYKDKYVVSFETGTNVSLLNKYVSKNEKISEPKKPTKDGYVFVEWQLDGKTYDFDTPITSDITLTAKWVKEEYITISFDTKSEYKIDDIKILKGTSIDELPESKLDGYDFIGWYKGDEEYTNKVLYDDTTLVAHYAKSGYEVGNKVKIIGKYAKSCDSKKAKYTKAIGWNREILYVIEGSKYPYAVGNSTGVTGYFNESSIEVIK